MVTAIKYDAEQKRLFWEIDGDLLDFEVDLKEGDNLPRVIYKGSEMSCPLDITDFGSPLEAVVKQKSENGKWLPLGKKLK